MSNKKSPNESTTKPKAPLRERGLKMGQELVDNLNHNVLTEHPDKPHDPKREELLSQLRKIYPNLSDEQLVEASNRLV